MPLSDSRSSPPPSSARVSAPLVYAALGGAVLVAAACDLAIGPGSLRDPELASTVFELRATRVVAAAGAGAALAAAGVLAQGIFRNPLADPGIIGASAGAVLGGQVATVIASSGFAANIVAPVLGLAPLGAMAGSLLCLSILLLLGRRLADGVALLLAGVLLTSLIGGLGTLLIAVTQDRYEVSRAMLAYALGGVDGRGPDHLLVAAPLLLIGLPMAWWWGRALDRLLSGDIEAASLGLDVARTRRWCLVWCALLTTAGVVLGGALAFVGLVAPHLARVLMGAAHRRLLPAAVLAGMAFTLICDALARLLPGQGVLPLGAVAGIVGAPLFVALLLRRRSVA
jgi:iron complex transport system permease protein